MDPVGCSGAVTCSRKLAASSRLRTVPTGWRVKTAISGSVKPWKYASSRTSRCAVGRSASSWMSPSRTRGRPALRLLRVYCSAFAPSARHQVDSQRGCDRPRIFPKIIENRSRDLSGDQAVIDDVGSQAENDGTVPAISLRQPTFLAPLESLQQIRVGQWSRTRSTGLASVHTRRSFSPLVRMCFPAVRTKTSRWISLTSRRGGTSGAVVRRPRPWWG
jgi:hypothetical protein